MSKWVIVCAAVGAMLGHVLSRALTVPYGLDVVIPGVGAVVGYGVGVWLSSLGTKRR